LFLPSNCHYQQGIEYRIVAVKISKEIRAGMLLVLTDSKQYLFSYTLQSIKYYKDDDLNKKYLRITKRNQASRPGRGLLVEELRRQMEAGMRF